MHQDDGVRELGRDPVVPLSSTDGERYPCQVADLHHTCIATAHTHAGNCSRILSSIITRTRSTRAAAVHAYRCSCLPVEVHVFVGACMRCQLFSISHTILATYMRKARFTRLFVRRSLAPHLLSVSPRSSPIFSRRSTLVTVCLSPPPLSLSIAYEFSHPGPIVHERNRILAALHLLLSTGLLGIRRWQDVTFAITVSSKPLSQKLQWLCLKTSAVDAAMRCRCQYFRTSASSVRGFILPQGR